MVRFSVQSDGRTGFPGTEPGRSFMIGISTELKPRLRFAGGLRGAGKRSVRFDETFSTREATEIWRTARRRARFEGDKVPSRADPNI